MAKKEEKKTDAPEQVQIEEEDPTIKIGDKVAFRYFNLDRRGIVRDIDDKYRKRYLITWREGGSKRAQWLFESQVTKV